MRRFRAKTGLQDFIVAAPLNLVYVAHGERMTDVSAEERRLHVSDVLPTGGRAAPGTSLCFPGSRRWPSNKHS